MTARRRASPEVAHPYRSQVKVAHRGDRAVVIPQGSHDAFGERLVLLREWFPFDVFHFPIRSRAQLEAKYSAAAYRSGGRVPRHTEAVEASLMQDADAAYRELLVDDAALERGLSDGRLSIDNRLRDAVSPTGAAGATRPSLADEIALAEEIDTFLETDAARRLAARVDSLERRLETVERSAAVLLTRALHPRAGAGNPRR
jgi:hypothetical protein